MTAWCGDWLLLEDGLELPRPRRSGAWRESFRADGRTLYSAPPAPGWVGSPFREVTFDGGRAWLFGESSLDDAGVARVASVGDASELGGRFLLLSHGRGGFQVSTDRFNTVHAYATDDARAVTSSFAAASAYSRRNLDWQGLLSFFACGFFLGERTFFDDVRCLAPARRHRVATPWTSQRYWHWRHVPNQDRTPEETAAVFAEIFGRAVAESTAGGRVALPLSGGLDSRALCAATPREDLAWSFGYGYQEESVEVRIARRLARARGLPFDGIVIEPYLASSIDHGFDLLEGFQDLTQTRQLAVADRLRERAERVLGGHWGDVWLDDMRVGAAAGAEDVLTRALAKLRKRGRGWLLQHLVAPRLEGKDADAEMRLEAEVAGHLGAYGDLAEPDFRLKAFKTDHWSSRWTLSSVRAYQAAAWPVLPFYDPRLADFFATVPSSQLADRRLEIDYLKRFAPDLARVPWQETGAGLGRSRRAAHWLGLPRRAVAKAWRLARRRPVIERNWEVQLLSPPGRRLLEERLLTKGLRLHDFVSPAAVRSLVDDFVARPASAPDYPASGYTVSMLLTFAVFLERA